MSDTNIESDNQDVIKLSYILANVKFPQRSTQYYFPMTVQMMFRIEGEQEIKTAIVHYHFSGEEEVSVPEVELGTKIVEYISSPEHACMRPKDGEIFAEEIDQVVIRGAVGLAYLKLIPQLKFETFDEESTCGCPSPTARPITIISSGRESLAVERTSISSY